MRPRARPARFAILALAALLPPHARAEDDAEKAAHADEAATPQRSFEERVGDVVLRQYQLGCLSQLTYLVGAGGEAAVVDPQRDVDHYLADARTLGLKITRVLLTHTNADFVAGHTELARRTGASVHVSAESGSRFPHEPMRDGDRIPVGGAVIEAWATPGHTLDSMTLLVRAPGAAADPVWAITGDTLFIGGIGRPDLVGGETTPVVLAAKAFDSMRRLTTLPDATKVLPAHGAGSLCGAHLSPETVSTIGREKASNPYLAPMSRAQFVSRVVTGLPVAPAYFAHNVRINREGPPVVEPSVDLPAALAPADVRALVAKGGWLVDLREHRAYAASHVAGAVNVAVRGRLDTWTGIVVPFDAPMVLVGGDDEVREAAFRFRRIGLDRVEGRLAVDPSAWAAGGLDVRTTRLVAPRDLAEAMANGTEPAIVDVRTEDEHAEVRVGDYANLPLTEWARFPEVLDRNAPVIFVCNSAYRSSMAVGLAERSGFADVASLDGGIDAWLTAGLATKGKAGCGPLGCLPAGAAPAAGTTPLPEPIEPAALAAGLMDQPSAWAVLDLRPAWAWAEYHVPGAVRVDIDAVAAHVAGLPATARVVLVDRDGTTAFAVAGAVLARMGASARPLRALTGGTARFHREVGLSSTEPARPGPSAPAAAGPAATGPAPTTPGAPPTGPATPKKRSAGC